MKKIISVILILTVFSAIYASCARRNSSDETDAPDTNAPATDDIGTSAPASEPQMTNPPENPPQETEPNAADTNSPPNSDDEPDIPDEPVAIVKVTNPTSEENPTRCSVGFQPIYEDELYRYYLRDYLGSTITVTYSDGTEINLFEALETGNFTLSDLEKYDIPYTSKPNDAVPDKIVDKTIEYAINTSDALELFYEDDVNCYYYPSIRSEYVVVCYKNGAEQPVSVALAEGRIGIEDLKKFKINFYAEPKQNETASVTDGVVSIVDNTLTGEFALPDALEYFYTESGKKYYFTQIKSQHVIVTYSDGTEQNVKEALADGRIAISDLDAFGIGYKVEGHEVM